MAKDGRRGPSLGPIMRPLPLPCPGETAIARAVSSWPWHWATAGTGPRPRETEGFSRRRMRHPAGPRPPQRATTIRSVLARMALLLVGAACTGPRPAGNLTPTLIPQPTPDRTVDAVVRGRVTVGLTGTPGTPGTPDPRATAVVGASGPFGVATPVPIVTAIVPT